MFISFLVPTIINACWSLYAECCFLLMQGLFSLVLELLLLPPRGGAAGGQWRLQGVLDQGVRFRQAVSTALISFVLLFAFIKVFCSLIKNLQQKFDTVYWNAIIAFIIFFATIHDFIQF